MAVSRSDSEDEDTGGARFHNEVLDRVRRDPYEDPFLGRCQNDREIVKAAVEQHGRALRFASEELKRDPEIVKVAVASCGHALEYACDRCKGDREIVRIAVLGGLGVERVVGPGGEGALAFASAELKDDRDFMLQIMQDKGIETGLVFQHASNRLKYDNELAKLAVTRTSLWIDKPLTLVPEAMKGRREFIKEILGVEGSLLQFVPDRFKGDRELVELAVQHEWNVYCLKHASPQLREELTDDREFMMEAVRKSCHALEYASDRLRGDKEIVKLAVEQPTWSSPLQYASSELRGDREIVRLAAAQNRRALKFASGQLAGDRKFVMEIVGEEDWHQSVARVKEDALHLRDCPELGGDREIVKEAVSREGLLLNYAHAHLKGDREIVTLAAARDPAALQYASAEFRSDEFVKVVVGKEAWLQALTDVSGSGGCLESHPEFQGCREIVKAAVTECPWAFRHASFNLKDDREIVKLAVMADGRLLEYASDNLQGDREILMLAVGQQGEAFQYASQKLKLDRELVKVAMQNAGHSSKVLDCVPAEVRDDREFMMEMIECNGSMLSYASERLRGDSEVVKLALGEGEFVHGHILKAASAELMDDRDFMKEMVGKHGSLLEFASDRLKGDREIVKLAAAQSNCSFKFASADLKDDHDFMTEILQKDGRALQYASDRVRDDREIVQLAVTRNGLALEHASEELKHDGEIVKLAVAHDGLALEFAKVKNREIVKVAVSSNGLALEHAARDLMDDKEIVKVAVKGNGLAMQYASDGLKKDREVLMLAIKQNTCALKFALKEAFKGHADPELAHLLFDFVFKDATHHQEAKIDPDVILLLVKVFGGEKCIAKAKSEGGSEELLDEIVKCEKQVLGFIGFLKNTVLPIVDFCSDIVTGFTYWRKKRYEFLFAVVCGMAVNGILSTFFLASEDYKRFEYFLNLISFGMYAYLKESIKSRRARQTTDLLRFLKLFEAVESAVSFTVASYSILIAGFLDGYDKLEGWELATRFFSIATSLACLPLSSSDYFLFQVENGPAGHVFINYVRASWVNKIIVRFYHLTETLNILAYICVSFVFRPWGFFAVVGLYFCGSVIAVLIPSWYLGQEMFLADFLHMRNASLLERCCRLLPLWLTIFLPLSCIFFFFNVYFPEGDGLFPATLRNLIRWRLLFVCGITTGACISAYNHPSILAQLLSLEQLPIAALALAAPLLHVAATIQQGLVGRWTSTDELESLGNYAQLSREAGLLA